MLRWIPAAQLAPTSTGYLVGDVRRPSSSKRPDCSHLCRLMCSQIHCSTGGKVTSIRVGFQLATGLCKGNGSGQSIILLSLCSDMGIAYVMLTN